MITSDKTRKSCLRDQVGQNLLRQGILALLLISITSCSSPKNVDELWGTYIADYDLAKETLVLNRNGKFKQEVFLKSTGKIDFAYGTWDYDLKTQHICFKDNYMAVQGSFGKLNPEYNKSESKNASPEVTTFFGVVSITIDPDRSIAYKKVSSSEDFRSPNQ